MKNKNIILELQDGGIIDFQTDSDYTSGCETCDYGSYYANELFIQTVKGEIGIEVSKEYNYPMSDGYLMQIMLRNVEEIKKLTEKQFFEWIVKKITEDIHEPDIKYYKLNN